MKRIGVLVISIGLCACISGSAGVFKMATDDHQTEFRPFLAEEGGGPVTSQSGGQYKFILLVDDDGSNGWPPYHDMRPLFIDALLRGGYSGHYDVFDILPDSSGPTSDTMSYYHTVIWFTGETWNSNFCTTLSDTNEAELAQYLDGGGNLFLSAQDYFYDRYRGYGPFSPGEFPYDYLGVTVTQQDAWGHLESGTVAGQAGSVANGLTLTCENPFPGHSRIYADTLGTSVATGVFKMSSPSPSATCALQYDSGTYKLVFTTLSLPGIADASKRGELLGAANRVIDWFLPPGLVTLSDSVTVAITDSTACKYIQSTGVWAIVGVRPELGSDWDMDLYTDPLFVNWEAQSSVAGGLVEFVAVDYNHSTIGCEGVVITRSSGAAGATVEYRHGADDALEIGIYPDTANMKWGAGQVAEIWDVELEAGGYIFTCHVDSGAADLGIALFHNPDTTPYYAGRGAALAIADDNGPGADESFTVTAPADDWYGFVVWANDASQAYYTIEVSATMGDQWVDVPSPESVTLSQNHPNPFTRTTTIPYHLTRGHGDAGTRGDVSTYERINLSVYDLSGRLIRILVDDTKEPGSHTVMWDGTDSGGQEVPSGVYLCQLNAGGTSTARKLLVLR